LDTVLASLIAVIGTLAGGLGTLHLQQRAALRADHRRDLHSAGAAFLTGLTAYRAAVYALWTTSRSAPTTPHLDRINDVRSARSALTSARDSLLLLTDDAAVRTSVHTAIDAAYHLGDDETQRNITSGRPAALAAHQAVLDALTRALRRYQDTSQP